jgi:hypothetical protein
MKIFDFNIHLPVLGPGTVNAAISNERELDVDDVLNAIGFYQNELACLDGYNFMLFNESLLNESNRIPEILCSFGEKLGLLTLLFDFRRDDYLDQVDLAYDSGIRGIKFHSYVQQIEESCFSRIVDICNRASSKGMIISLDASYGSTKMYKYDNLKLVCAVADQVNNTPILVLHSGGNRVLEAMLIAAEKQNVFLETSFSLSYYKGSSVENDIAFAYKKIGVERVLYGSDFPYVSIQESINVHHQFLEKHSFSTNDIEKIMFKNAQSLVM